MNPDDKKYNYEYVYTYSKDGLIAESNLYQQRGTLRDHLMYNRYFFTGSNLTKEQYNSMGKPTEEVTANYKYLANGQLESVEVQCNKEYMNVDCHYDLKGQLEKKIISKNTDKQFKQIFLLVPYLISSKKPYTIEEVYSYDERSNITSVSRYADNVLFWQMIYEIEYYN